METAPRRRRLGRFRGLEEGSTSSRLDCSLEVAAGDELLSKRGSECFHTLQEELTRGPSRGPCRSRSLPLCGGSPLPGPFAPAWCDPVLQRAKWRRLRSPRPCCS